MLSAEGLIANRRVISTPSEGRFSDASAMTAKAVWLLRFCSRDYKQQSNLQQEAFLSLLIGWKSRGQCCKKLECSMQHMTLAALTCPTVALGSTLRKVSMGPTDLLARQPAELAAGAPAMQASRCSARRN